jgi:hypothetical protein
MARTRGPKNKPGPKVLGGVVRSTVRKHVSWSTVVVVGVKTCPDFVLCFSRGRTGRSQPDRHTGTLRPRHPRGQPEVPLRQGGTAEAERRPPVPEEARLFGRERSVSSCTHRAESILSGGGFRSPTIWDPTRWNFDRKKSDTPTENGARVGDEHRVSVASARAALANAPSLQRRPGDPRERIRKENDGIVLSPQRRSFNSGCCVPGREPRSNANRPHSPLGKNDASAHLGGGGREIPTSRRIGSGRILRDSWDFGEKQEAGADDYNFRPQQRNDNADRRSFGRDFDVGRDKEKERRNGSRFSDRRRIGECGRFELSVDV